MPNIRRLSLILLTFLLTSAAFAVPLVFEPNAGQTDPRVHFLARSANYTFFVLEREAVVSLSGGDAIRLRFVGARPQRKIRGEEPLPQRVNDFRGSDQSKWVRGVSTYARLVQSGIYDGIDLVYRANGGGIELDWVIAPGADPGRVRLVALDRNGKHIRPAVDATGDLIIRRHSGVFRLKAPRAFQGQTAVPSSYAVQRRYVSLQLGQYDADRPLLIDPVLSYSTYLGGTGADLTTSGALDSESGRGTIAVDGNGYAYVAGNTHSTDFPLRNAIGTTPSGPSATDAFVTKLTPGGTGVVYSTYLGGSLRDDAFGIAVDGAGNAYITGGTDSTNFPTTLGAFRRTYAGGTADVFVTKLDASGQIVYSTYLGGGSLAGNGRELAKAIAVGSDGSAYITGDVNSTDFPTTVNAFQRTTLDSTVGGSAFDAFVTKLDPAGSMLVYSTYLGEFGFDSANDIAVDNLGQAYICGTTRSGAFPTTAGAFQRTLRDQFDVFIVKLSSSGSSLIYSTLLGGGPNCSFSPGQTGCNEAVNAIAIDSGGNAYVTGWTDAKDFPVTAGAFQTSRLFGRYGFVTKLNSSGTALLYSTFLGSLKLTPPDGSVADTTPFGIGVDSSGNATVTGHTAASDFALTADATQPVFIGSAIGFGSLGVCFVDGFVTRLNAAGSGLLFSTFLGGAACEEAHDVALDASGNAYTVVKIAPSNRPTDFPTANAFMIPSTASDDAAVVKIGTAPPAAGAVHLSAANYSVSETGGSIMITVNRTGGTTGGVTVDYEAGSVPAVSAANGCDPSNTSLGCDFTRTAGTLLFAGGQTSATFTVPIRRDASVEGDEFFLARLTNATGGVALGAPYDAKVTITDAPANTLQVEKASYEVRESGPSATLRVLRFGDQSQPVTVDYRVDPGTAQAGSDYTPISGTLSFAVNETFKDLSIPILEDSVVEPDETLTFVLSAPAGGALLGAPSSATIKILDNDSAGTLQFSQAEYRVNETAASIVIRVDRIGGSAGTVSVNFATSDGSASRGSDYTATSGRLDFSPGMTQALFIIPILAEPAQRSEGHETVDLTLSSPTAGAALGSRPTAILRILDRDLIPGFVLPVARTTEREEAFDVAFDGTNFLVAIEGPLGYSTRDPEARKILAQLVAESETLAGPQIDLGRVGYAPAVAFGGTNYLLVWDDETNIIHGQLIARSGARVGTPFVISPDPPPINSIVEGPSIDSGGANYLMAWSSATESPTAGRVYEPLKASILSASGMVVAGNIAVSTTTARNSSVAFDGTNFLVMWLDAANNSDILGQFISPAGTKVGAQFLISQNLLSKSLGFKVGFGDGSYFVVWNEFAGTAPNQQWDLMGQIVTPSGQLSGTPVSIAARAWSEVFAHVTFGAGRFLITWSDLRNDANNSLTCEVDESSCGDIFGRFYNRLGSPVTEEFTVAADPGNQFFSPAAFGASKYFVAYNTMNVLAGAVSDVSGIFVGPLTAKAGDGNGDGVLAVPDVIHLINALFGPGPGVIGSGDANGDGRLSVADIFYLINHLFAAGPPPV